MTRKCRTNSRWRAKGKANRHSHLKSPETPWCERRRFDRLLISLASRFKNAFTGDLDGEIGEALKEIASYFGCDRIAIWRFTGRGEQACLTHHFAARGAEKPVREIVSTEFPYITSQLLREQTICAARVDDLSGAAVTDRQSFLDYNLKSLLAVPISLAGTPQGCLSLATIQQEHAWSEQEVNQVQRLASVLGNALDRQASHHLLEERVRFETLLSDLSVRFISLPGERMDDAVAEALDQILALFGADYCGLFEVNDATGEDRLVHASRAPGATGVPERAAYGKGFPWSYDRIVRQGKPVVLGHLDDLPAEAEVDRETLLAWGIEASIAAPIPSGAAARHCIFLASANQRTWPSTSVPRLVLFAGILVNTMKRNQSDLELKRFHAEISELKSRLEYEAEHPRFERRGEEGDNLIFGQSEAISRVLMQIEQVAQTNSTVLIHGETGTGKELVAQEIHRLSERSGKALVKVNCASLPGALVESELFGREKGAYTGALSRQAGRFEIADGSTIFLDEIGELSTELQAKLLRVLQEGSFERLGSPKTIKVDARVLVATNRNLAEEVSKGTFREDLFYRLNVFPIFVPPLRQRMDDIPLLTWVFIHEFTERMGKKIHKITKRDMEALQRYSWPGNIRELRNVIEYAVIVSTGDTLNLRLPENGPSVPAKIMTLEELESHHISEVLRFTGGRIKGEGGAARLLGMNPSTLYSRMLKLGITSR